jgi:hypothetical protein
MTESRFETAERHVRRGREIVRRQRELVAEIKARGLKSKTEDSLLVAFELPLTLFEWDLERSARRRSARTRAAGPRSPARAELPANPRQSVP